ncbi:MAG: agmatine deiminase family protein, partial [Gammaproteobacteria bacterium]|nr:agmatine deiminase family protein [Gammaproteobacteria bacterium]
MSIDTINKSPSDYGFRMPAEWEPHERTWMMWPCRAEVWGDMAATKADYVKVAQAIREFEALTMVVNPEDEQEARKLLGSEIDILVAPIDDSWARDAAPNFLINDKGQLAGSAWQFNAWGETYVGYDNDNAVGEQILESAGAAVFVSELVGEGGAVLTDGEGTILTTETCLLNPNRNPGWTKNEVEQELLRTLGAKKVIWMPGNADEDETNGHVDGLAQFIRPGVVLAEISYDMEHPWYDIMQDNINSLRGQTDAKGRELDLVFIEDAHGCDTIGEKFCTSYINSLICNGGVLIPKYGIDADDRAVAVYQRLFPE